MSSPIQGRFVQDEDFRFGGHVGFAWAGPVGLLGEMLRVFLRRFLVKRARIFRSYGSRNALRFNLEATFVQELSLLAVKAGIYLGSPASFLP